LVWSSSHRHLNLRWAESAHRRLFDPPGHIHWQCKERSDATVYKARNIIERAFNRLKDWHGIATRYDKAVANFLAGVCLAVAFSAAA
jgi:transposase